RPPLAAALPQAAQTVVPGAASLSKVLLIDAYAVIADTHPEHPLLVSDFSFDVSRVCVGIGISQCLARDSDNFIPHAWTDRFGIALNHYVENRRVRRSVSRRQFCSQRRKFGRNVSICRHGHPTVMDPC